MLTEDQEFLLAKTLNNLFLFVQDAEIVEEFDDTVWLKVNRKDYETIIGGLEHAAQNDSAP